MLLRRFSSFALICGVSLGALSLSACHSSATERAVSPLMGTWQVNGALPEPDANLPRFTCLSFRRDGTMTAYYVAAGGALANVVKSNSKVRKESDTYTLYGKNHIKIIEGSRALDYSYTVRDGKLFLTPQGSDTPIVFKELEADDSMPSEPSENENGL